MKRISWIDIARGLGILFVIYGHGLNSHSIRYFFYAFHMPLFFFLSGIVFHVKKHEGFLTFLKKSAKNILLPYVIIAYISYALWYFTLNTTHFSSSDTTHQLLHLLYGNGKDKYFIFNNVLWFLPCLFVTRITFALISHFTQNRKLILLILFLFSLLGYFVSVLYPQLMLPFGAEIALSSVVFFGFGYLWQTQSEKTTEFFSKYAVPLFAISFLVCMIISHLSFTVYHQQIDMRLNHLNNYFYFYLGSLSGILWVIMLSTFLKTNRLLEYLGRHTLILFAWHLVLFSYFVKFLTPFLDETSFKAWNNLYLAPLYTILSIIAILLLARIFAKIKLAVRTTSPGIIKSDEKK